MACVENPPIHGDDEREEGEIVDELDDLSDISSEEEFLLRQRLHMLEKYNNVLERKNAKRTVVAVAGKKDKNNDEFLCDLSEISATELEESFIVTKNVKEQKHSKTYHKPKRRKDPPISNHVAKKVHRKKSHKYKKKTPILSESSEESDDEYRNKRRKLAHAVAVTKTNVDKTSLKARLFPTMPNNNASLNVESAKILPHFEIETQILVDNNEILKKILTPQAIIDVKKDTVKNNSQNPAVFESVDLCSDADTKDTVINGSIESVPSESHDTMDSVPESIAKEENIIINETQNIRDSDEDLELLREHALKTKTVKADSKQNDFKTQDTEQKNSIEEKETLSLSEDEDSDTAELRMICLKSALLKKAIEMKRKQKLRKRLSQSSNLNDELMRDQTEYMNQILSENNTDIESVDMDIGSDGDEKSKEFLIDALKPTDAEYEKVHPAENNNKKNTGKLHITKEDEFEEDEDLLRAKLLTSLSKNLPNLVDPNVINSITDNEMNNKTKKVKETEKQAKNEPEEKRFIINLRNSDSEGEHEATKNLTKMHMKLSEQIDFQQKLDMFLKSTRMEVEKSALPDVVQQPSDPPAPKPKEKFIPKTVKHLPKSEQIEYKNLVKRMAELEKMKNSRQTSINLANKGLSHIKETLKPRNAVPRKAIDSNLEEQIALSRKNIADESAKVLKLKEEATKLSQKYKIVATELRNIATAITLNKKEQRAAQIKLSKIRTQHQLLINSSTVPKHSIPNGNVGPMPHGPQKLPSNPKRPQKENAPVKEEVKTVQLFSQSALSDLQSVKVRVVNDRMEQPNPRLSVQVDVTSNKKTVQLPNSYNLDNKPEAKITDGRSINAIKHEDRDGVKKDTIELTICNWGNKNRMQDDDYKSPLQALGSANWEADPNAVLCRFEVGGNCKDPDCKYLHPKTRQEQ